MKGENEDVIDLSDTEESNTNEPGVIKSTEENGQPNAPNETFQAAHNGCCKSCEKNTKSIGSCIKMTDELMKLILKTNK